MRSSSLIFMGSPPPGREVRAELAHRPEQRLLGVVDVAALASGDVFEGPALEVLQDERLALALREAFHRTGDVAAERARLVLLVGRALPRRRVPIRILVFLHRPAALAHEIDGG